MKKIGLYFLIVMVFVVSGCRRNDVKKNEEEKLKPAETRKFIEYSFRDGVMKTTGTDVDKILPPMSRFGGGREKKKLTVIQRLKAFFERFFGIS